MAQVVNQYSALFFGVPLLLLGLFLLLRGRPTRWKLLASVLLVGAAGAGFLLLRPGAEATPAPEVEPLLDMADKPVLLEFYSDL
ncbi:MAG: hypothetical protein AB1791_19275 [Chloroflexota bacterium]